MRMAMPEGLGAPKQRQGPSAMSQTVCAIRPQAVRLSALILALGQHAHVAWTPRLTTRALRRRNGTEEAERHVVKPLHLKLRLAFGRVHGGNRVPGDEIGGPLKAHLTSATRRDADVD